MRLAGYPAPATPIYDFALNRWIAEEFAGKDRMIQLLPSAQVCASGCVGSVFGSLGAQL